MNDVTPTAENGEESELETAAAARIGGVSDETVRRYVARGLLKARRLPSGRLRFRREDVERAFDLAPSA